MQILTTDAPQKPPLSCHSYFGLKFTLKFCLFFFISLCICTPCAQASSQKPLILDQPAQPLETALRTVSEATHTQIFYLKAEVQACTSPALKGHYKPAQAFRRLIKNCPLRLTVSPSGVYVISRSAPQAATHKDRQIAPAIRPERQQDETVIITARPGAWVKTRLESGYAVSKIDAMALDLLNGASVAESLKAIPGLWVEASGGEASNNIRARGIPRDGYASLAVYEDGLPVQHDAGLGYLNVDQSFRIDDTIQSIEVVRGGPASVFASNAPGGLINIISRRAADTPQASLRVTAGDHALRRVDLFVGAPVGQWRLSFGGFYREDQGLRHTGFKADYGGQYRLSAVRTMNNSEVDIDYRHLDDNVAFYLPVPVRQTASGAIKSLANFKATDDTLAGPDLASASIIDSHGQPYPFDLKRGTDTLLDQFTFKYRLNLSDHTALTFSHRTRQSLTWRNAVFPGSPRLQADKGLSLLPAAQTLYPTTSSVAFAYVDTGATFTDPSGQDLILEATLSSVRLPLREHIGDIRLVGEKTLMGKANSYSIGLYTAHIKMAMQRLTSMALIEARPQARRLNVLALDPLGQRLGLISRDGIIRDGAQFDNVYAHESVMALYAADELKLTPNLIIDAGLRLEVLDLTASIEQRTATDRLNPALISDDLILGGTGQFDLVRKKIGGQSYTIGMVYDPDPDNLTPDQIRYYGRLTKTVRLPSLSDLTNASADNFHLEPIWLWEAGYKRSSPTYDLHAVAFATFFSGYRFNDTVYDPLTRGYVQKTAYTDTQTIGLEMEGLWRPNRTFEMGLSATLQQPRFAAFQFTELVDSVPIVRDYGHNQLLRVPQLMVRWMPAVYGFNRKGRLGFNIEYYSDRFGDAANRAKLPAYLTIGLNARYRCSNAAEILLTIDNLSDTIGLTEGNPRAGQFVSTDSNALYFSARPIFGRTVRFSFKQTF